MVIADTDHITLMERPDTPSARRLRVRLEGNLDQQLFATIISYEEQSRGWLAQIARARSMVQQIEAYKRLHRHLDNFRKIEVLDFDEVAASEFQHLQRQRIRIGTLDLKIAAIALTHNATLLSRNLADFRKVPNLKVEDWTTE
jgi:tRNA(fMet)-specific endonuclease VapC